jgi:alkylhydroperoxidase/carboxymuconolactone decarboxylase family protein YurZ
VSAVDGLIGTPVRRRPSAASCEHLLRLAIEDASLPTRSTAQLVTNLPRRLDDRTRALVCLGALVATGAGPTSYRRHVRRALAAGATPEDVMDTLVAVSPTVGLAHLVSATAGVALGLGYDVDAAFEGLDDPPRG